MSRPIKVLLSSGATIAVAAMVAACGTERISVPKTDPTYAGAVLFSQRCSGCHTLSYAGTHGSASNPQTAQANNGPNFDIRCERPVTRVLYAIENGGFSGAVMPQNVVVGKDAVEVAEFVAKYAGRGAPKVVGIPLCVSEPIGTLPSGSGTTTTATTTTATTTTPAAAAKPKKHARHKAKAKTRKTKRARR